MNLFIIGQLLKNCYELRDEEFFFNSFAKILIESENLEIGKKF
jgi:hypothetical protein